MGDSFNSGRLQKRKKFEITSTTAQVNSSQNKKKKKSPNAVSEALKWKKIEWFLRW